MKPLDQKVKEIEPKEVKKDYLLQNTSPLR